MTRHGNHGDLDPGRRWDLHCDHPGCTAISSAATLPIVDDLEQKRRVRACAEENGWYLAIDRGDPEFSRDLCPEHAPPQIARARFVSRLRL